MDNGRDIRRYVVSRRWSDRFLPEVRRILGEVFIRDADRETDTKRATDMMTLTLEPLTVGIRIRRFKYFRKYGGEFTVRYARPSGDKTELKKVLDGHCRYGFYGFATKDETGIAYWTIYDLDVLRAVVGTKPELLERIFKAHDAEFVAFSWVDFPPDLIVASNLPGLSFDRVANRTYLDGETAA